MNQTQRELQRAILRFGFRQGLDSGDFFSRKAKRAKNRNRRKVNQKKWAENPVRKVKIPDFSTRDKQLLVRNGNGQKPPAGDIKISIHFRGSRKAAQAK